MADLESLINELPKIVYHLKLTIGNSQEIMQQVILINNAQEQLRQIQQAITQNLSLVASKSAVISMLPDEHKVTGLIIPSILQVNPAITGNPRLIAEKFGNPETEISLVNLKSKINCWLEWGDLLQAIAADILVDANLVNQINLNIKYPSLLIKIQDIKKYLEQNIAGKNRFFKKKLNNISEEVLQVKNRLTYVIDTIKNSQNLLTIILAVSSFCGQSGFAIEWLDDAHELIISSDNNFRELTDILNDCENYQNKIDLFSEEIKEQKHQPRKPPTIVINHPTQTRKQNFDTPKIIRRTLVMASSLAVLGFGGWLIKDNIPQNQSFSFNFTKESTAVSNFKSALKLGMQASFLAQNPPHPLSVWQQAASKWQEAIQILKTIPDGTSVSAQAQERLIRYQLNYLAIKKRAATEKQAVGNLELAGKLATEANYLMETSPTSLLAWQQAKDKWQQSIKLLEAIPKSSSVYKQAQETLPNYKTNYTAINAIMKNRFQSVN
ncbi:hypothetical protein Nos7524_3347 [Nostoc sp. PCC 7524]|uniref:hypothetical protein n=1 Tax=Nostoc sp. (strain ATCC 29411 / PCC 7524) TaxID=28072 RepID=UPI00029ECC06|nr:hypothetical protein [Nostoc sp. PCC 7524]AFY49143.1 hypothetical protein Nos7524_3347 [Nostoc sp. PCC 7524]